jgi:hypothetical protein
MKATKLATLVGVLAFAGSAYAVPTTLIDEDFNAGIPAGWSVTSLGGGSATWGTNGSVGNSPDNYTGGTGLAADASSDEAGTGPYDTSLITPSFSLANFTDASLDFLTNYQALGVTPTNDNFDIDISTDGGATWVTALAFENDTPVGGLFSAPGVAISIDLAAFLGESDVTARFHYYNDSASAFDWYAQVDDVTVSGNFEPPAVPEPASLALIALGVLGLGAARRRRS